MDQSTSGFSMALSSTQERILDLLAAGVSQVQTAAALGVEESYVSQLMANEEFRSAVSLKRADKAVDQIEHDGKIDDIEEKAWERVQKLLPMETNLMRVLKVAQVANAAKRKTETSIIPQQPSTIVNIALPQQALVHFKLSSDKQVVEVEGRSLATMPSHVVQAKMRERKAQTLLIDATPAIDSGTAAKLASF